MNKKAVKIRHMVPNESKHHHDFSIYHFKYFNNFTDKIYITTSPPNLIKKILDESERQTNIEYISAVNMLAGDIKKEVVFSVNKCNEQLGKEIMDFLAKQIEQIIRKFPEEYENIKGFHLDNMWINYQKAGEYNPIHIHESDFSFVWYLDIPETIRKEYLKQKDTNSESRGMIEFISERIHTTQVFNPQTGDFLLFKASLPHTVYPFFTEDVTRISMSGNITLTYEE